MASLSTRLNVYLVTCMCVNCTVSSCIVFMVYIYIMVNRYIVLVSINRCLVNDCILTHQLNLSIIQIYQKTTFLCKLLYAFQESSVTLLGVHLQSSCSHCLLCLCLCLSNIIAIITFIGHQGPLTFSIVFIRSLWNNQKNVCVDI